MGGGGEGKRGRGAKQVLPLQIKGGQETFSHAEGGDATCFEVVKCVLLRF